MIIQGIFRTDSIIPWIHQSGAGHYLQEKRVMKKIRTAAYLALIIACAMTALSGNNSFNYDPEARINQDIKGKIIWGYYIDINLKYALVYFKDKEKHAVNKATYNCEKQFWAWKHKDFDSSKIDLTQLFSRVDLSKTTLDRPEPVSETVYRDNALETKNYDYSRDKDFSDFISWCKRTRVPEDTIKFYINSANNAAKRGTLVDDTGRVLSDNDTGIQAETFKPAGYKNKVVPYNKRNGITKVAGGMQLYFEYRKRTMYRYVDEAQNIFRDNKTVPVTIVELEPLEGNTGPKILRGNALIKQVRSDLESSFHKKFKVKHKVIKISYTEFGNYGNIAPLTYFDQFMTKHVNPKVGRNTLIIYYFTDSKRLLAIDDQGSHPLHYGPYGTDWGRMAFTIIHEMGHSLGLRHHFNDRDGSADIKAHISPACIMNYKYKSQEFCPLCRYGLGIDR